VFGALGGRDAFSLRRDGEDDGAFDGA